MGAISDKAQTTESVTAGLDKSKVVIWPCLKCSKATKAHHGPGERICSNPICEDRKARKVVNEKDLKSVLADTGAPRFPCPKCGKESKEDHAPGRRICSAPTCRNKF